MARASRSRSKTSSWRERLTPSAELGARARRGVLLVAALSGIAAVGFGAWLVRREVVESGQFDLSRWDVEFGELPPWVTPEIAREIESVRFAPGDGSTSLFRSGVLREFAAALAASPWIHSVAAVRLRYPTSTRPGAVEVDLRYRQPVAIVEAGGLYRVSDRDGMSLGAPYSESPAWWFRVPVIVGARVSEEEIPGPGKYWAARDVREGLAVASILQEEEIRRDFPDVPIDAIDVSNVAERARPGASDIVLRCGRSRLEWGRSPYSRASRTLPVRDVVRNLRWALSHLEQGLVCRVELFHSRPVLESL